MTGTVSPEGIVLAHSLSGRPRARAQALTRLAREDSEDLCLAPGATRSSGAGRRAVLEEPDPLRTCFERDHDRILHSSAFRRLAGKTQVFVFPRDHQRTRLTHALAPYLADGYNHAIWGADVVLAPLNLCIETLDGIRHHSWSLPSPATPEGAVVSWADRCAYCAHDLEDAAGIGIVDLDDLPAAVVEVAGRSRSSQLRCFITALVDCITTTGEIGMRPPVANALAELRAFNYERIYTRASSIAQGRAVIAVLSALVEYFAENPEKLGGPGRHDCAPGAVMEGGRGAALHRSIAYVSGMTDRFAFDTAVELLGWPVDKLPRSVAG